MKYPLALHIIWAVVLSTLMCRRIHGEDLYNIFKDANNIRVPDTTDFLPEYDYVIIGAGSAGSVVANRLSEIANYSVLLLEAGVQENFIAEVPLMASMMEITQYNWGYKAEPTPNACRGLNEGICKWPKGRALGGTSVINFMVYVRGQKSDFNHWASLGNPGWSYKDVLPYFIKSERVNAKNLKQSPFHGTKGPLDVSYSAYGSELVEPFLKAGVENGYKVIDANSDNQLGFDRIQANIRNGKRCSAAKAFLYPIINRKNLHISQRSWVTKIIINPDTKIAVGVEFLKNRKRHVVAARKEVILSAGAVGSPQILMLSGVGPKENLESLGIPVIQDLKVGYNLQDHVMLSGIVFPINQSITIVEGEIPGPADFFSFLHGTGPYTSPAGAEGVALIKVNGSTLPPDVPDVELVMGAGSICGDRSGGLTNLIGIPSKVFSALCKGVKHAFDLVIVFQHPKSRGRISLKSRNPFHWPRMVPNYLQHPDDMAAVISGIKAAIKIGESKSFKKYGNRFANNPIPNCQHIAFRTDEYWECYVRHMASTIQHQSGTCKMGPSWDSEAVVDAQLKVKGILGLRVVDNSIMPTITGGHPNSVAYMIGEKASDMIKADMDLKE